MTAVVPVDGVEVEGLARREGVTGAFGMREANEAVAVDGADKVRAPGRVKLAIAIAWFNSWVRRKLLQ